ncbi:metal ABC transporter substrate-binding protein [Chloroflexota bacterium]
MEENKEMMFFWNHKKFVFKVQGLIAISSIFVLIFLTSCSGNIISKDPDEFGSVLAVETFLADIARNIVGDRMEVESLLPIGVDLHTYQPAPRDIIKVSRSTVLIINGGGIEAFLSSLLENAGGDHVLITASAGLTAAMGNDEFHHGDPHFWMDPILVIKYVEKIRDGLMEADPAGEQFYRENALAYIQQLNELDTWIKNEVEKIPLGDRKLITNHDSLGYFARRYGFEVVGTLIPGLSSEAVPTARDLVNLVEHINASGAKAIFMETGASTNLADQISGETDVILVTDLFIGSLSKADGPAATYIEMMEYNVTRIVETLKND